MIVFVIFALVGGVLVGLSRQLNGRLALSTTALMASFWNHLVGFVLLCAAILAGPGLWPQSFAGVPHWAWFGGAVGVLFVASGSWLILRIGAVATAILVIAGQMVFGVVLDLWLSVTRNLGLDALGVALILAGVALTASGTREG
jgi:transporter family-2 protein